MNKLYVLVLSAALVIGGCGGDNRGTAVASEDSGEVTTGTAPIAADADDGVAAAGDAKPDSDWPNFSGDGSAQSYSALDDINLETVDNLSLAWYYDLEPGFSVSSPVKGGDKLFITTGNSYIRGFD